MPPEMPYESQDELDALIASAEYSTSTPTLDLHGKNQIDARHDLEEFLNKAFMEDTRVVRIMHGKGMGTLQKMAQLHLRNHPLVDYVREPDNPRAQGAVIYVVLGKK